MHTRCSKQSSCHQSLSESPLYTRKKPRCEMRSMTLWPPKHNLVKKSLLYHKIMYTWLFKDRVSIKANLDNYKQLINPREHTQNMRSILELVTQDIDAMCKVLLTTFSRSARVWYYNLEPNSILYFYNLNSQLIYLFSICIPTKKSITQLFVITQREDESTRSNL